MAFVIIGTEFFSVRGNRQVQEKIKVIKNHGLSHENVKRHLEAVESKRSNTEYFGVPETTLTKRLKKTDSTDCSMSLQGYVFK
jgi:hypothetical protein